MVKRSSKYPVHMGGIVEKIIRSAGLTRKYYGWMVVNRWPEIAGEINAQRSIAKRYEDGILFVSVPDASWRNDLTMQHDSFLEKIHEMPFGKVIEKIRFIG